MSLQKKLTFTSIFSKPNLFLKELGKSTLFLKKGAKGQYFVVGISLIGLVFLFVLVFNFYNPFRNNKEASLMLAFENNGQGRMFEGEVIENMTVLDALVVSSNAGKIELKYSVSADGKVFISGLDGYNRTTNPKKLVFYLNGFKIYDEQINSTIIKPGDNIEVRLE